MTEKRLRRSFIFAALLSAFFKSAGTSCTTPLDIRFCDIDKLSFRNPQRREDLLLNK